MDNLDDRLRTLVASCKYYDQLPNPEDLNYTMSVATLMTIQNYVAEGAAADDLAALAAGLAANPSMTNLTTQLANIKAAYSGNALTLKFNTTGLTTMKVFQGLVNSGEFLLCYAAAVLR